MQPIDAYLILGVLDGNSRQVASALQKGANANTRFRGRTILLWAVQEGHLHIIKRLIHAKALLEAKDKHGFTSLDQAVGDGNLQAVELLLKAGANVNGITANGSALHTACAWRHLKIVKILLAHGANPTALDEDKRTPISYTKPRRDKTNKAIYKLVKTAISSRNSN